MMGKTNGLFAVVFAVATLAPLVLFALAICAGGAWGAAGGVAGLLYMTALAAGLDRISGFGAGPAETETTEFPAADLLLVALACSAILLMPATVWALTGTALSLPAKATLFLGVGLWLGQVGNATAHELIHRGNRWLFRLGSAVYCVLLFGHHSSAHRLVHHRHAASLDDPNTARAGEGYYRFFLRAWAGSFLRGWAAEDDLRRRGKTGVHPYAIYIAAALGALALGYALAGGWGLLTWAALAFHAQAQLLLSDYVQHYGLIRARLPDGRSEPVGIAHSWNAPHWFSSAYMLNAPRHSDHHAHPARPYPALRLPLAQDAPRLPWPLPLACMIALAPPLWRRAIRPHLARWRGVA
jgi:alkane 1-monooxygenase